MACATALMRTSLPPLEKNLCCQFEILLNTLSFISLKKLFLFLSIIDGNAKYFAYLDTTLSWNKFLIAYTCPYEIFPLKNIEDFS